MPDEEGRIRVLVVEDHTPLAEALAFAFGFEADIEVVGVAPTVTRALELVAASEPDVVLMDVRLPDGSGIEATPRVLELRPGTLVIVLTAHTDPTYALRAAEAGAAGFAPKDGSIAKVVACVRQAAAGEPAIDATMLRSLLTRAIPEGAGRSGEGGPVPELSPPEQRVVELMAEGRGRPAIADRLGIPADEAARHMAAVVTKLRARSHLEALVIAARAGLLKAFEG